MRALGISAEKITRNRKRRYLIVVAGQSNDCRPIIRMPEPRPRPRPMFAAYAGTDRLASTPPPTGRRPGTLSPLLAAAARMPLGVAGMGTGQQCERIATPAR